MAKKKRMMQKQVDAAQKEAAASEFYNFLYAAIQRHNGGNTPEFFAEVQAKWVELETRVGSVINMFDLIIDDPKNPDYGTTFRIRRVKLFKGEL